MAEKDISFLQHIDELRGRLIKCVFSVLVCGAAAYYFNDEIIAFLAKPVGKLVFIDPVEAFATYIKVAIWGGLFLASPYCIFQVWQFIGTGLRPHEKKYTYLFLPASFLLFVVGSSFGFWVIVSVGMQFLLSFGSGFMVPMISISRYVSFVGAMVFAFGIVFQLPLAMLLLTKLELLSPSSFQSKRRYVIVAIFIVSGALTPSPDVFSQFAMALPLLFLYEIGIMLSRFAGRKNTVAALELSADFDDDVGGLQSNKCLP